MSKPSIRYTLETADGCKRTVRYEPFHSSLRYKEASGGAWAPHEPQRETTAVLMEMKWAGGRRAELLLDGDQHRDLEDGDLHEDLFARIADGEDPDVALAEVLELAQSPTP
ncbi:hypothetical protein ACW0US_17670 [Xanthomonas euvesicatoria]